MNALTALIGRGDLPPPPPRPLPPPVPAPSCCAGLMQTVLHGWQDRFPLHSSPFYRMSASSGATPKELLGACEPLQASGALQPIRARWGDALPRMRWRLGFRLEWPAPDWAARLADLPGCLRIERPAAATPQAWLWAEIEALDATALQRQLDTLPQPPSVCLRVTSWSAAAAVAAAGDPREDPALAMRVERGLPLGAGPYGRCARELGRTERQVLASLRAWQREGALQGFTLAPALSRTPRAGLMALWHTLRPSAQGVATLRGQHGVERLLNAEPRAEWPWRFGLVLQAAPGFAAAHLDALLAQIGIRQTPDLLAGLHIEQPRDAALLFGV